MRAAARAASQAAARRCADCYRSRASRASAVRRYASSSSGANVRSMTLFPSRRVLRVRILSDFSQASHESISQLAGPIRHRQAFEVAVVGRVQRPQFQISVDGNGRDLPIHKRRRLTGRHQSRPLAGVPLGRALIVCQHGHGHRHDFVQVSLNGVAFGRDWQPVTLQPQLVPDRSRDRQLGLVLLPRASS